MLSKGKLLQLSNNLLKKDEENMSIKMYVENLPECYQKIWGHPEFDYKASRCLKDREELIREVIQSIQKELGKKEIRVLDIGCAQGYYSLMLGEMGCLVKGVDYESANIKVCKALSEESGINCDFEVEQLTIEFADNIDQYDVILLLNVIHHVSYANNYAYAKHIFEVLSQKSKILLTELAVKDEPLYWNVNLPNSYYEWFDNICFYDELAFFETHLSSYVRPFVFCSNNYVYVNGKCYRFDHFQRKAYRDKAENRYRKYYFTCDKLIKVNRSAEEWDRNELLNELSFLQKNLELDFLPKVIENSVNKNRIIAVYSISYGKLLWEVVSNGECWNPEIVLSDIIDQLTELEKRGLYHGDLRSWNVCINSEGHAFLIDFGNIQETKIDIHATKMNPNMEMTVYDTFMSLIYDSLLGTKYPSVSEFSYYDLSKYYDLDRLDERYKNLFVDYLLTPLSKRNFVQIKNIFRKYVLLEEKLVISEVEKRALEQELLKRRFFQKASVTDVCRLNFQNGNLFNEILRIEKRLKSVEEKYSIVDECSENILRSMQEIHKIEQTIDISQANIQKSMDEIYKIEQTLAKMQIDIQEEKQKRIVDQEA